MTLGIRLFTWNLHWGAVPPYPILDSGFWILGSLVGS
jgi:hypothetical protein